MAEEMTEARDDADAGQKLDKILTHLDSLTKRMDALEKPPEEMADADETEEYEDAEGEFEFEGEPEEVVGDSDDEDEPEAKKDAEGDREMEETAKADSMNEVQRRIDRVERMLPKQLSDADYAKMADAQAKADSVYQAFGDAAPRPLQGENLTAYRRRLAKGLQSYSAQLKEVNLSAIKDPAAFNFMEGQIYSDAMAAALTPRDLPLGQLREIKRRDSTGRQISEFVGQPISWLSQFTGHRRRVSAFNKG